MKKRYELKAKGYDSLIIKCHACRVENDCYNFYLNSISYGEYILIFSSPVNTIEWVKLLRPADPLNIYEEEDGEEK